MGRKPGKYHGPRGPRGGYYGKTIAKRRTGTASRAVSASTPLGYSKTVKMKYSESKEVSFSSGTVGLFRIRANGLNDPDQSGIGHQPYGYDQIATYFSRYVVESAKIKVRCCSLSASGTARPIIYGVRLDADLSTTNTFPNDMIEDPLTNYKVNNGNAYNQGYNVNQAVTKSFSTKRFFNIKDLKDQNYSRLAADTSSDPADEAYFTVMVGGLNASDVSSFDPALVTIEVEYVARFFEPKELITS